MIGLSKRFLLRTALVLVLSLLALGIAHANWSDQLLMRSTVSTGSLQTVWFYASCDDNQPGGHEVATWSVTPINSTSIRVDIVDGYPTYVLDCDLHLANAGNLPVRVSQVQTSGYDPAALMVSAQEASSPGRALTKCDGFPAWGTRPGFVHPVQRPGHCRQQIDLKVEITASAQPGDQLGFLLEVTLELVD